MKLNKEKLLPICGIALGVLVLTFAILTSNAVETALASKPGDSQTVDSGAFSVTIGGKHIATESFRIEQSSDGSITHSELRINDDAKPTASYDLEMDASGNLRRYHWEKLLTDKASLIVEPTSPGPDSLLIERIVDPNGKTHEVQHLLPTSTIILDDNFFSQRELLAWRFLASGCKPDTKGMRCELPKREYGTLNPSQHFASDVFVEFAGQEKTSWKGTQQNLMQIKLTSEEGEWLLWLDEHEKVVKMSIPSANTEIARD